MRSRSFCARAASTKSTMLGFEPDALGDVAHGGDDQRAVRCGPRAQADLNRELGAVSPSAPQAQARPHRSDGGLTFIPGAVGEMGLLQVVRDEDFRTLADELVAAVAEQLLDLRIGHDDRAVRPDDEHAVGRGVQKSSKGSVGEQSQQLR